MTTLEREILAQARDTLNNRKLKIGDILEWSTSEDAVKKNVRPDEVAFRLENLGVWLAVAQANDKRAHDAQPTVKAVE